MRKSFGVISSLCLLAFSLPSYADTLWTLSDVVFTDGSSASGSFVIPSGSPLACPAVSYGPIYCLGPVSSFGGATQVAPLATWSISTATGSTITTAESFTGPGVLAAGPLTAIEIGGQYYTTGSPAASLGNYYPDYDVPGLGDVGSYVEFINNSSCMSDPNDTGCSVLILNFDVSSLPDLGPGSGQTVVPICTDAYDPAGCGNQAVSSLFVNEGGTEEIAYADPGELVGTYIPPAATPEPGTDVLLLTGVGLLGLMRPRRRAVQ